jgi:hydroxymethylpyrimidine pyrophosphatase-like HAD family hydrolase
MPLRCVYTDLDGTLLGAGASLFRTGEGEFTLLPARGLEVCHRAGVEVVCVSGRRKAQVMEDARLIGQDSYIYEIGAGVVVGGEEHLLCGEFTPTDGRTPHALIEESGAPALLLERFGGRLEYLHPYHRDRFVSHLFRGTLDVAEANDVLQRAGHTGLRLLDNGSPSATSSIFHLVPVETSKVAAVALHMQARGYAPGECIAVGDSAEDMAMAETVGRFFLVANSDASSDGRANVRRTESGHGDGFYEAVVASLMDV